MPKAMSFKDAAIAFLMEMIIEFIFDIWVKVES